MGKRLRLFVAAAGIALAGLAWWQRTPLLTWYYLRQLAAAGEDNRATWVDRAASLDSAVVPGLVDLLQQKDPAVCASAEQTLSALVKRWGPEDVQTLRLAEALHGRFAELSPLGQVSSLEVMAEVLRQDGPQTWPVALTRVAGDLLQACRDRPELRGSSLVLAGVLLDRVAPGQWLDTARALADKGLGDRLPRTRLAAIQLLMRPPLRGETALLAKVVPMLHDEKPLLRRAALVALAPARDLVSEDDLLALLHDDDIEVQHLCEQALRSRGLSDAHLELARLISDQNPRARLKVLDRLARVSDLDPSAWVRRLTQDPCAAVRAAAVRAAAQYPQANLAGRLHEMAQQDPSETVRQNAQHYLRQQD
jgi:hypothetical protein